MAAFADNRKRLDGAAPGATLQRFANVATHDRCVNPEGRLDVGMSRDSHSHRWSNPVMGKVTDAGVAQVVNAHLRQSARLSIL